MYGGPEKKKITSLFHNYCDFRPLSTCEWKQFTDTPDFMIFFVLIIQNKLTVFYWIQQWHISTCEHYLESSCPG